MPILCNDRLGDDIWRHQPEDAPLSRDGRPLAVSLETWWAQGEELRALGVPLALDLGADQDPTELADALARDDAGFEMIAIRFDHFTDGRGYSLARLLRERHGFRGELRATGRLLADQAHFLARCGFDAVEIADADAADSWRRAAQAISVTYQPAAPASVARRPLVVAAE